MTQPAKAQEPSMEEILASIRRIIADDDANKSPPKADSLPPPPAAPLPPVQPPAPRPAAAAPPPKPAPPAPTPPPAAPVSRQVEIDAMLASLNAPSPVPPRPPERQVPDVLELTEAMAAAPIPPSPADGFRTIDGQSDIIFDDSPTEPVPEPEPVTASPYLRNREEPSAGLVSSITSAAVDSAFNSLAQTVLVQNARTLEDLVREMLRPLLKTWLDDNLPGLVERLVRAEIERVSRGRT
jgi:uncharacterized protein